MQSFGRQNLELFIFRCCSQGIASGFADIRHKAGMAVKHNCFPPAGKKGRSFFMDKSHGEKIGRIIVRALGRHKVCTVLAAFSIAASIALEVLPPLVLGRAVDALTGNAAVSLGLAALYFGTLAAGGLVNALREAMIVVSGESITHTLRSAMMAKLQKLPADYFTKHEAGEITSLEVNDVDAVESMFSSGLVSMCTDLGTVIAVCAVVFSKSRGLGILLLAVLPLLFIFTRHVQKKMLAAHVDNRRATAEAGGILPETMRIARSLHVYHAEKFAEKRYTGAIEKSFRSIEKTNFYDAVYSPVIMTVSAAVIGIMMSLSGQSGAFRSWFGMSVGTAVALISYVNNIFTPLSSIGMEIQEIQAAAAGWKRVRAFLGEEEVPLYPARKADPAAGYAVCVRGVDFSYDGTHAVLDHFSMQVKRGEFVTLTGRTGAGKSTLFKLLLGLYAPDQGEILIEGIRPREFDENERRGLICCVEQKVIPVPGTVRDQVTLGDARYGDGEIWKALEISGLRETVEGFAAGLDEPYSDAIFSHGQKQLLMIARAVVSNPKILLLDEITAGLDSATEKLVLHALARASESRTVISISHRRSEVMPGRVLEIGKE